jgi:hypothetical protein
LEGGFVYDILLKVILAAALLDLGRAAVRGQGEHASRARINIPAATKCVLKIDWKPISVFPEEAKRFR